MSVILRPSLSAASNRCLLKIGGCPQGFGGSCSLTRAAERLGLSARAWHRTLRVARTLADLDCSASVRRLRISEALSYRRPQPPQAMAAYGLPVCTPSDMSSRPHVVVAIHHRHAQQLLI